ncbi:MAG: transposase [Pseudomonadota bacterium]
MTRPIRMNYPDSFYHVLSRGNEKKDIFHEENDYLKFLDIIGAMVGRFTLEVHAYVLMKNHYHLLVRTKEANLSRAIQWLGVSYSIWFNRRYERSGHLFQGRFKSFLIEDDRYFTAMCLYIHGNPLRAGMVERLSEYPWSSYQSYAGERNQVSWLTTDVVLGMYGGNRKRFLEAQQVNLGENGNVLKDLRHGLYLGSEGFWEECKGKAKQEGHREKPQFRLLLRDRDVRSTMLEILERLGEKDSDSVLKVWRGKRPMRDVAIYILYQLGVYRNEEIGEVFGIGYTAVSGAVKRGKRYLESDAQLKKTVKGILIDI